MQFTIKGSVNFVPRNIVKFIWRITCICTLHVNALPRMRDAEGFCNTVLQTLSAESGRGLADFEGQV